MTGEEMLAEINRRKAQEYVQGEIDRTLYYAEKGREHAELEDCMATGAVCLIIVAGLLSIAGHVKELWDALASCF